MPHPDQSHPPKRRRYEPQQYPSTQPSTRHHSSPTNPPSSSPPPSLPNIPSVNPYQQQPPWCPVFSSAPFPSFDPSALQSTSRPFFDPSKSLPLPDALPPLDSFNYGLAPPQLGSLSQLPRQRTSNPPPMAMPPNSFRSRPNTRSNPQPAHSRRPIPSSAPPTHHNRHPSAQPSSLNPIASPPAPTPSIRQISPVKEALSNLRDGSPIMSALAETFSQRISHTFPPDEQRLIVLGFSGFKSTERPTHTPLLGLSKSELDVLAWIFVVSKHGRKEDVARRIISSLREPLKHRSPLPYKKPPIPEHSDAHRAIPSNAVNTMRNNTRATRTPPQPRDNAPAWRGMSIQPTRTAPSPPNARASMPTLAPQTATSMPPPAVPATNGSAPPGSLLNNLARQIQSESRSPTATANRSRQVRDLCQEMLEGYSFLVAETPFNRPMNPPLGSRRYVFFTSVQLSRGLDPSLSFPTPIPITPDKRPVVAEGDLQIHIRCLRVEVEKARTEWKQAWPFPASCRVNGNNVQLNQAQRYTNGKLAGKDSATNITPYLRKPKQSGGSELNRVVLRRQNSTASAAAGQYIFFAQEILVISHESMSKSVTEASEKYWLDYRKGWEKKGFPASASKFEMAQHGVIQFLTDPDGLTVSSMKVSLRCPLALTRIATPVKGRKCQHVQCFDLSNFLEYSRRSSKFDCPVCNKPTASPANLIVSPYIEHALEKYKECDEVEIFQDGAMVPVERKQTGVASDDDEEGAVPNGSNGTVPKGSKAASSAAAKVPEVVDLTLDSDDDNSPAVGPSPNSLRHIPLPSATVATAQTAELVGPDSTGAQGPGSSAIGSLEQDMDFTFRSDFVPWGDAVQSVDELSNGGGLCLPNSANTRPDLTCDVIAIDSD